MNDKTISNPFVESDQAERIKAKKARTQSRAVRASDKSTTLYTEAKAMAGAIPFGQPILIGHHSEKRDRNYRNKITSKFDRSFQAQNKADELAKKAETIGTGGISSTAPDALVELRKKLEYLQDGQSLMKKVNAEHKKGGIDGITSLEGAALETLKADMAKSWHSDKPYASYSLTNNNANIRRIKQRIADLERLQNTDAPDIETDQFHMFVDEGRIQFEFNGKPNDKARKLLKSRAFKWSRYSESWVRKATANAVSAGKMVASDLQALGDIY